jgi:hypothetical protein
MTVAGKRACTCSKSASSAGAAIATADLNDTGARPGEKQKVCCVCGKDVTHSKRMKDAATGRYWCFECGSSNPVHKAHAMDVPCPECKKHVPPTAMVKYRDHYVCAECYARHTGKLKGKPGQASAANDKSKTVKILVGIAMIVGGLVFIAYYLMSTPQ